jgi:hypothetical protein
MTEAADKIEEMIEQLRGITVSREDVAAIVEAYGRHIGVEGLALDAQGAAEITADDEVDVALVHLPPLPGVVAAASVAAEVRDGGALARRLLQANTSFGLTEGGVFAMLPGRPEMMLCRLITLPSPDLERLDQELAAFVDLVRTWRDEIEDGVDDDGNPEPPEGPQPDMVRA